MNKRILAWLLTLCMVLSIVPFTPITVSAADDETTTPEVKWGADINHLGTENGGGEGTFMEAFASYTPQGAYIQLQKDCAYDSYPTVRHNVTENITIDLNGCNVTANDSPYGIVLRAITSGVTVTFTDSKPEEEWGTWTVNNTGSAHGLIFIYNAASDVNVVVDAGNYSINKGAIVKVNGATYTGKITLKGGNFTTTGTAAASCLAYMKSGTVVVHDEITYTRSGNVDFELVYDGTGATVNLTNYEDPSGLTFNSYVNASSSFAPSRSSILLPDGFEVFDASGALVDGEAAFAYGNGATYYYTVGKVEAKWGADENSLTAIGTFADALAARAAHIKLMSAATLTARKAVEKSVVIDLNGQSLTNTAAYAPLRLAALGDETKLVVVKDTVGTGAVTKTGKAAVESIAAFDGTVDIQSGTYESDYFVVYANHTGGGLMKISGGTFKATGAKAPVAMILGNVAIYGGTFVTDVTYDVQVNATAVEYTLDFSDHADPAGIKISFGADMSHENVLLPEGYELVNVEDHTVAGATIAEGIYQISAEQGEEPEHTCTLVPVEAKAATCTEGGWEAYQMCEGCDQLYDMNGDLIDEIPTTAIDENAHDWGAAKYTANADGTHTAKYTCTHNSDHTKSDAREAHTWTEDQCDHCTEVLQAAWGPSEGNITAYGTFAHAVAQLNKADTEVGYIQLLSSIDNGASAVYIRNAVTIDLNGNNIETTNIICFRVEPKEEISDSLDYNVVFKGEGTVTGTTYGAIYTGATFAGTVTVQGGTYYGTFGAQILGGTFNVEGGTFKGFTVAEEVETLKEAVRYGNGTGGTVSGGKFIGAAGVNILANAESVTISGGDFSEATVSVKRAGGTVDLSDYENITAITFNNATDATTTIGTDIIIPDGYAFYADGVQVEGDALANDTYTIGAVQQHTCTPELVPATPATCVATGIGEHKKCECGKLYDMEGQEIAEAPVLSVDPNAHVWGETPASYTVNDDGTHTAIYVCTLSEEHTKQGETAPHDFTDGDCACGKKPEAQIGDKYYATLAEAFAAGGEIVLLSDVEVDANLIVDAGMVVTLNLGQHTLTPNGGIIGNYGTLTIIGGTIASAGEDATIQNHATMTVVGTEVNGSLATSGVFTINSGHVHYLWAMTPTEGDASTTINDGTFDFILLSVNNSIICFEENHETIGDRLDFDTGYVGKWVEEDSKFIATALAAEAGINGTYYSTIQEAIDAVDSKAENEADRTITLNSNVEVPEEGLKIDEGVILDTNGNELIVPKDTLLAVDGHIVDTSKDKTGVIKVEKGNLLVPQDNPQVPVWNGDSYTLTEPLQQHKNVKIDENGKFTMLFRPTFGTKEFNQECLGAAQDAAGITILLKITWDGGEKIFYVEPELAQRIYAENGSIGFRVGGLEGKTNIVLEIQIFSETDCRQTIQTYYISEMLPN